MKKLLPLLFLLILAATVSAKTNTPVRAQKNKTLSSNPMGGPPPIPSSIDGLGPPPAIPLALDVTLGVCLLSIIAYGVKKVYYPKTN